MTKKLVQINIVCNGSTGRIMNQIHEAASKEGWESECFYGRGKAINNNYYKIGNKLDLFFHVLITRLFNKHGHWSKRATKKLIKQIERINPDVIQIHNIHGYYIHLKTLFDYLKKCNKKIVWTLHDCWAFTGHCSYFTCPQCDKWKRQCCNCIRKKDYPKSIGVDTSKKEYLFKKELFTGIKDLTIITPSNWLAALVKESFLKEYKIKVINNGIDLNVFKPTDSMNVKNKYNIPNDKKIILGVANVWDKRKGLSDFIELSKYISEEYVIVLVGLNKNQIKKLPKNMIGIKRTENIEELVNLYTISTVLYNPSKEESFLLVAIEAIACGTPFIGFNTGIIAELANNESIICLEKEKNNDIIKIIKNIKKPSKTNLDKFSVDVMVSDYIKTYTEKI